MMRSSSVFHILVHGKSQSIDRNRVSSGTRFKGTLLWSIDKATVAVGNLVD